jgi:hypothetical protein
LVELGGERVRGGQLEVLVGQENRCEGCNTILFERDKILACILFLLPPSTRGQREEGLLQ